ncbi:MAG: LysM peptidoglycan-binding domain-containing protein [Firmicutes bacterium]|nr:LysM peptidoglycan-binding domain-containing protein [Bacillota bacterium]
MYSHSGTIAIKNPGISTKHAGRELTSVRRQIRLLTAMTIVVFTVVIILSAILSPKITFAKSGSAGPVYESVRIETGDTMWDIASRYAEPGTDIRSLIRQIEELNHISADFIYDGQYLIVPVSSGS